MVVSHGLTLKAILGHLIALPFEYLDRLTTGGNMGLSIVQYEGGVPRLTLLNDTSHCQNEQLEPPLL
jgi:broad specificity phosphatase PhoE